MYQFFVEPDQLVSDENEPAQVRILGADYNHMKNVVRLREEEQFRVSVSDGRNYMCSLEGYDEEAAIGIILKEDERRTELLGNITLYQGLPKGDKMELIIQKAVELGAARIVPVRMRNSVVKLDDKKAAAKVTRWQAIAQAAAKQSKRSMIPVVDRVMSFSEALADARENDKNLVPYENQRGITGSREILKEIMPESNVGIFIGPEGGFDPDEIDKVKDDMDCITLGNRILRTETAAITTLSLVMMQMEQ